MRQLSLIRKETYSIEEVLLKRTHVRVNKKDSLVDFDGDLMKMNSHRYETFDVKGIKCSCCGIEGKFFAKEKSLGDQRYHFNLYAINDNGRDVLMTKDHIVAKSLGGKDHISNYQTMCETCNKAKGIMSQEEFEKTKQIS